jgi:phosphatidylglycerophosphate synthase
MHQWLLNTFSTELLVFFFIMLCIALSFSLYIFFRRYFAKYLLEYFPDNTYFARALVTSSTILFAFTIIVLWQTLLSTKHVVAQEANAFSKIVMISHAFAKEEQKNIQHAIQQYLQLTVQKEWPLMKTGKFSAAAETAINNVDIALENYSPRNAYEQIFYREALTSFSAAYEARHARLERLESVIPGSLYAIIILGIFLLLLGGALIQTKETRSHLLLMIMTSIVLGSNLAIITIFDYPFSGSISISNQPFTSGVLAPLQ